jgi:glutamine amidotransferase
MIAIIDYDMGNLRSVEKALERVGAEAVITRSPGVIDDASHVVLPGVGAFGECMRKLEGYGLTEPVVRSIESGKPFLGICLGLQLLFEESEEFGSSKGLGQIKGRVVRFPAPSPSGGGEALKIPHMGWNSIRINKPSPLLAGVPEGSFFYFVHSYYAVTEDKSLDLTTTGYGVDFASSIAFDNVFACQFHPEKSHRVGLKVLENFKGIS